MCLFFVSLALFSCSCPGRGVNVVVVVVCFSCVTCVGLLFLWLYFPSLVLVGVFMLPIIGFPLCFPLLLLPSVFSCIICYAGGFLCDSLLCLRDVVTVHLVEGPGFVG